MHVVSTRYIPAPAALLMVAVLTACSDPAATIRKVTYPPDFKYIERSELQSAMGTLAQQLLQLETALALSEPVQDIDQEEVKRILAEIENTAQQLDASAAGSNHPFLQDQMNQFTNDIQQARIAASLSPPRYYAAGKLAGGCVNCHRINR
jgi:hypothetical protein